MLDGIVCNNFRVCMNRFLLGIFCLIVITVLLGQLAPLARGLVEVSAKQNLLVGVYKECGMITIVLKDANESYLAQLLQTVSSLEVVLPDSIVPLNAMPDIVSLAGHVRSLFLVRMVFMHWIIYALNVELARAGIGLMVVRVSTLVNVLHVITENYTYC